MNNGAGRTTHALLGALACLTMVAAAPTPKAAPLQTATFSAGCYWTVEAMFEHVRGVRQVVSGITGQEVAAKAYVRNTTGTSGGAEGVQVTFDPAQVTYEELLRVFFEAVHDPTQVDRQGPDVGTRYRSVLWVANDAQRAAAVAAIAALERARAFPRPVVTQVAPVGAFSPVPEREQDFVKKYPRHPYVVAWDHPRLDRFRTALPSLFTEPVGG